MSNEQNKKWTQGLLIGKQGGQYPSMGDWQADNEGEDTCCSEAAAIVDSIGQVVCIVVDASSEYFGESELLEANHARLVECWNFLADHPDLDKVEVVSKDEIERLRKDSQLYQKLRNMHWSDGEEQLVVIRARNALLGTQTYTKKLLDEAIQGMTK